MGRTLLVEDNVTLRQSLKETLHSRFPLMDIIEAGDGVEAFQKIKESLPDLIFMDIKLPGENGLSLTKRIKTEHPGIVIVVLTSYDLPEYREAAFQYNANYFFTKASSTHEIMEVVESVFSGLEKEEGKITR